MHRALLKCFGVGDGWPSADRGHSAFLYRFAEASFLIDCGEPISRSYKASALSYDLVDHLFLSHLHFDHAGGFFMLMQSFWLERRHKPLPVHLPLDAVKPLQSVLQVACIFPELLPFPLEFHPLRAGEAVKSGSARVTPFPTTHLSQMRASFGGRYPGGYEAFSFLIEADGRRIGHSADIGAVEDLSPLLEKPLDVLVCELAHVEADALFAFLRGRSIRQVVFIHLSRDCRASLGELHAQAEAALRPMKVIFAEDGSEIEL
ncbi:MAG: MBL fold metallo-hydrolase [Verrucomicrobiota bacterium]